MVMFHCLGCLTLRRASILRLHGSFNFSLSLHHPSSHPFRLGKRLKSSTSWIPPDGHDTGIKIYNSASKTKVPLKTIYPGLLTWYSCGPTVYDSAHIGHALCYVKFDIIRRVFARIFNHNVVLVMGVTDIDDKIIKRASELNLDFRKVTKFYEEEFFADMDKLRVIRPSLAPRVTEHIPNIITFTQNIMNNHMAYAANDGSVYFDTKSYGRYGKMITLDESLDTSASGIKKSPRDFALWKAAKPGEPYWESPWGNGRPGWHIECSAMANHILGPNLDVHSGGIDLLFPHHENEEAQCCAHSVIPQWCNHWLHTGHLHAKDTEKMSKSLHNTISVRELLKDHSVDTFRIFCLLSHYRSHVDYHENSMVEAGACLKRVQSFLQDAYAYINGQLNCGPLDESGLKQKLSETRLKVKGYLADDIDTPRALATVLELITYANKELHTQPLSASLSRSAGTMVSICSYIHFLMEDIFGINLSSLRDAATGNLDSGGRLSNVMNSVVSFRKDVRSYALLQDESSVKIEMSAEVKKLKKKERLPLLQACDNLRLNLQKDGLLIKDHKTSSSWSATDTTVGMTEEDKKKKGTST